MLLQRIDNLKEINSWRTYDWVNTWYLHPLFMYNGTKWLWYYQGVVGKVMDDSFEWLIWKMEELKKEIENKKNDLISWGK